MAQRNAGFPWNREGLTMLPGSGDRGKPVVDG